MDDRIEGRQSRKLNQFARIRGSGEQIATLLLLITRGTFGEDEQREYINASCAGIQIMTAEETGDYVSNYADVRVYELTDEREEILLKKQTECTFMWTNSQAEPVGVIMNFVWRKGSIWLTATKQRARIPAIRARPRVAVAITSRGTDIGISQAITYKGTAVLHEDAQTNAWLNTELANAVRPAGSDEALSFAQHLANSPGRLAIEVIPDKKISFDSYSLFKNSPTGPSKSMLD